jgi:hypothetical protein
VLSFFVQPIADDFVFAHQFQNNNYFELIKQTYFGWSGRYFSNALIYLNPISFDSFTGYKLFPIFLFLFTAFVFQFFIKTIFREFSFRFSAIISLSVFLIYLAITPNIAEQLYWFTGSIIYHVGLLITLLYFSLLCNILRRKSSINYLKVAGISILLFIASGFNEIQSAILLLLLLIITFLYYKNNLRNKRVVIIQLLFISIFVSIMLLSPGNESRLGSYPDRHQFVHSLTYSLAQVVRFSGLWIFSPALVFGTALYLAFYNKIKKSSFINSLNYMNKWASLILLFLVVFVAVFPPYWATGILGQHRTVNVACFFFIVVWFFNLSIWLNAYGGLEKLASRFKPFQSVLAILFFLSITCFGNGQQTIIDLYSGDANHYNLELEKRHMQLLGLNSSSNDTIYFEPIVDKPKSIFVLDISYDPNYWTNQAYNVYFEVTNPVVLKESKTQIE